jgi:serine/threonine-protein kinase RsbW
MQRRILIIDDNDDLATALSSVFAETGHYIEIAENRNDALSIDNITSFDLVVTDLDGDKCFSGLNGNGNQPTCLPTINADNNENIKAFKLCAANFRRDGFNENELKNFVETILDYKAQFVDRTEVVQNLHEKIEFELPSAIATMHSVLDYLMKRVEKIGVIDVEQSNLFIALDEAFVNAVKHGNKFDSQKLVRITAEVSAKEAKFTIEDEGEGFKVSEIPDPTNPENLFKTSGRGVMFIYNIMDEVKYNERGNRLEMIKRRNIEQ